MKKLFTLALVLLVAVAGDSQVKNVSVKEDKNKVATMQQAPRIDAVNEYVQSQPNMTRQDGELDYTVYDWQSNAAARTWTIVWPDGKINFAFTHSSDATYGDRGTAIGTYDAVADEWIPSGGRVENNEKTGFGSIARYKDNGIIVAAHTANECGLYLVEDKDNITNGCAITLPKLNNEKEPTWPVVMTSGEHREIIHVLATAYSEDANPLYYYRSMDGGETWDKQNEIIPFLTSEYGSDWGSNIAYFMETTEDNCLAFVVSNAWSDCMVIYSYDNGDTWERKVFWHHPGINTTIDDWFMYPRWTSAQWGLGGELCLAFEFNGSTGEPGSGSYYPSIGGVAFWSENLPYAGPANTAPYGYDPTNPMPPVPGQPFIMDSAYMFNDIYAAWPRWSDQTYDNPYYFGYVTPLDENGNPQSWEEATEFNIDDFSLHGSYNSGISAMPVLVKVPGSDADMVAIWSAMDENHMDGAGKFYYKLFASYTADGGRTWAPQIQLTNMNWMFAESECVYTQAAVVGTTLVVATQMDFETGTYVQSDDNNGDDNYYQGMTFELNDIFPGVGVSVPEVSHNTHMSIYPNPAVDQLNVSLSQNDGIVIYNIMGQAVMNIEGHAGANSINISELGAGVYFISAGSDTQKFIVK